MMVKKAPFIGESGKSAAIAVWRGAVVVFALGVTALAGGLAWSLSAPLTPTPLAPQLLAVHESRAEAALAGTPPDVARARRQSLQVLALSPVAATAWLRLGYLRYLEVGKIDAVCANYIEKSYTSSPLGPDVTAWRMHFLFENWPSAPASLKARATEELIATSRFRAPRARAVTEQIHNPAGRFAAQMATAAARSYDSHPENNPFSSAP